jgi:hypothetical protein
VFTGSLLIIDAFKWLSRNRDSIFNAISAGISFTFMLIIGYLLLLGSTYIFLKGLNIDPTKVPFFNHETAMKCY